MRLALAGQVRSQSGQDLRLSFLQWPWDGAAGGKGVAAAAKLECYLGHVESGHGAQPYLDVAILALDENGRDVCVVGADEETDQPGVTIA